MSYDLSTRISSTVTQLTKVRLAGLNVLQIYGTLYVNENIFFDLAYQLPNKRIMCSIPVTNLLNENVLKYW